MDDTNSVAVTAEQTAKLLRLASSASLSVALILIVAKLIAWGFSDSVSVLATLIDSLLDALASLVNLIAVRHALTPADKEHRFGHGKAEALAGLSQSMFIAGSASFLLLKAGHRLINPTPVLYANLSIVVMLFSIFITLLLLALQRRVIRQTQSVAIKADALHYRADILVNSGVILALWLSIQGWTQFDSLIAGLIGIYILYSAWEIIRASYDHLMDRELPDEERATIEQLVLQHRHSKGLHDLRTRHSGSKTFIQLHLELDDNLSLLQAHKISDEVEISLQQAFPGAEVIIHIDPQSVVGHEALSEFK